MTQFYRRVALCNYSPEPQETSMAPKASTTRQPVDDELVAAAKDFITREHTDRTQRVPTTVRVCVETFEDFSPRRKAASFTIDDALAKMAEASDDAGH